MKETSKGQSKEVEIDSATPNIFNFHRIALEDVIHEEDADSQESDEARGHKGLNHIQIN